MSNNYLLEIGLEEIPARFLSGIKDQFAERMSSFLKDSRLSYQSIESYATPRRIAVIIRGLAESQDATSEKVKGPALRIAKNDEGEWTKAALGFLRGQNAEVQDIFIETYRDEEYIFVNKNDQGQPTKDVLSSVGLVLDQMTFPVSMNWHDYTKPFIRPVHWIVSLLNEDVVPFDFMNVEAGRNSRGHHFLGHSVDITSPDTYTSQLRDVYVIADMDERKQTIREQIERIASEKDWQVPIDLDLLDEVTSIVEWPHAFWGEFEKEYLQVPSIILMTAMRDHQRYFYALDKTNEQLLPYFISVRNGNEQHIENVIRGNYKVLKARLDDALFFYQEDISHDIEYFVAKLAHVKEHYKLSTLDHKQERVGRIIHLLAKAVNEVDYGHVAESASKYYKFDLTTMMVDEFSELQGNVGEIYSRYHGLPEAQAVAIGEQYMPTQSGGQLPQSIAGALLALSDKIDTLVNYFNVGLIPTGSNDPYGLRRQAMGIVEIMYANHWSLNLNDFFELLNNDVLLIEQDALVQLNEFISARLAQFLERQNISYDIVKAVASGRDLNIYRSIMLASDLQTMKQDNPELYQAMIEALVRVINLGDTNDIVLRPLQEKMSQTESEQQLIQIVTTMDGQDVKNSLQLFTKLIDPIEAYFENNMVNADNKKIRNHRLSLMHCLTQTILKVLDPRKLVSKF